MLIVAVICLLLVLATTVTHYEALRLLNMSLPRLRIHNRLKLLVVILAAFVAHALEISFYGAALYLLVDILEVGHIAGGTVFSLATCMYFSAENFTSLGFGDLMPVGPVRLIAGVEALNGLLLIAWSASFTYLSMEKFWSPEADKD